MIRSILFCSFLAYTSTTIGMQTSDDPTNNGCGIDMSNWMVGVMGLTWLELNRCQEIYVTREEFEAADLNGDGTMMIGEFWEILESHDTD
eukprot:GFUD01077351.1.p1 GENE.GFUD01077351.1~~GFUD01077351.1.p1  ORF type:complete len:104 (-),score=21.55 GFUD01077351.1:81-350(-)